MSQIEKALSTAEIALKEVYLPVITDMYNNQDKLLALIPKTTKDVWGNKILYIDEANNTQEKNLKTITVDLKISERALKVCLQHTGAFVNLLNSEIESSVNEAIHKQLNLLYEEVRKDCEVNCTNRELKKVLLNFERGIIMQQLSEWKFLTGAENKFFKYDNGIYIATLVKYCNFVIDNEVKQIVNKIKGTNKNDA